MYLDFSSLCRSQPIIDQNSIFLIGKLATGSKDNTVIIWDFDPESLTLKMNKSLEPRSQGVSFFAWSPDSTRLAVCGPEDCDEVKFLTPILH
jgi:WD40 repeat protein